MLDLITNRYTHEVMDLLACPLAVYTLGMEERDERRDERRERDNSHPW